jgi:hypothetical protein
MSHTSSDTVLSLLQNIDLLEMDIAEKCKIIASFQHNESNNTAEDTIEVQKLLNTFIELEELQLEMDTKRELIKYLQNY